MGALGLRQDSLRDAVRAAGITVPPVYHPAVGSTSNEARALATEGAPEWTVVATDHQTAGRGRLGRTWTTPAGAALTFSLLLRPPLPPEEVPLISLLAAAQMAEACAEVGGIRVRCKWPNDLVVGERKLGGLLAEAETVAGTVRSLVLGIGVNLTMEEGDFPPPVVGRATSLVLEGAEVAPDRLLRAFLLGFRTAYAPERTGFAAEAVEQYRHLCGTLGARVRATTTAGETVSGRALDVDDRGALVLDAGRVAFGEIEHLEV